MTRAKELKAEEILQLLAKEPEGLEVQELVARLGGEDDVVSMRGVRNLLNELVSSDKLIKKRSRWSNGPGAPPYVYFHPNNVPQQLGLFDRDLGIMEYHLLTKAEVEREEIERDELKRLEEANSVLERIASGHLHEEVYARAIIETASEIADVDPVDLVLGMMRWVVDDLNELGGRVRDKWKRGAVPEAEQLAGELEFRLSWARHYFQRFWRLDRGAEGIPGILELPRQAKHFFQDEQLCVRIDEESAKKRLRERIRGGRVIEEWALPTQLHTCAVGTDASVADIFLEHTRGSFIPPDPVVVLTAAAALRTHTDNAIYEYQDFDVFPDHLREYADHAAAVQGLVISPLLKRILPERDFKHSRMAAMELRQYWEDLRITLRQAEWRPIGTAPMLGIVPRPTLIFRDGRMFPLVHRLKDYEDDGLYGQIVRSQIEKFAQTIHHTLSGPGATTAYGAVVKSPELSWLAPLVFWYLHSHEVQVDGRPVVHADDVYRSPFADTAVSHLLFLGMANKTTDLAGKRFFVTFRAQRRFSDIAIGEEQSMPVLIRNATEAVLVDEDSPEDWQTFIQQRIAEKQEHYQEGILDLQDYSPFTYLCSKMGVSMLYAAPTSAYELLTSGLSGDAGHFLLPRLEVAVDLGHPEDEEESIRGMLSWLAWGGCELDSAHTQSGYDTGDKEHSLPILVPDVIVLAHEAVGFARDKLGDEVQDEIRALVAELKRRVGRGF